MEYKRMVVFLLIICLAVAAGVMLFVYYKNSLSNIPVIASGEQEGSEQPQVDELNDDLLKIVAVGDILLGRGVGSRIISQHGGDFTYPFASVVDDLKSADLVFANLECPISDRGQPSKYKPINLRNSPGSFEAIKFAGFNILNLATNHIMDYGSEALLDTLDLLKANGIAFAGAGRNISDAREPAIVEIKGKKIGMLAYTDMAYIRFSYSEEFPAAGSDKPGVAPLEPEIIKQDATKLREMVDIVIVSLHWGIEESFEIAKEQTQLAHELMDLGVDIIIGHHPHQFQAIEVYNGKPIMYSLGNFLFDQNDPENQETFIVNMEYEKNDLKKLYAVPVRTIEKTQVVRQYGDAATSMLERQAYLSQELGTECEIIDSRLNYLIK